MFASLSDRLAETFKSLRGKGRLSASDVDGTVREIRRALLDADVAVPVVRQFAAAVRERALSEEVSAALNPAQQVVKIVHDELVTILGGEQRALNLAKRPPTVIMLAGLQGAGKTTLAGKLSHHLKSNGHTPMLVAADLQRPNAVTQLQVVGERAEVPVFAPHPGASESGESPEAGPGNPVAVAEESLAFAREKLHDVVIVDTAGRLGVDQELMQQAADIRDAVQPDEILFVIDAMTGQDAVSTAQAFDDGVNFTGVVLSKLDGDARGGAALSVASVTGKPILYASTGEGLEDFEIFHPDRIASRILDMGDMLTLIEQAERAFDAEQAEEMAAKMQRGDSFSLEDFLQQLQAVKQMGSMKKLLGMMPGMAQAREQLENFDEREIDRIEAIVRSMTPGERANPKILNGSRRSRIARGAGTTVTAVNQLMQRFESAQTMMKQMNRGGGAPGMPGAPGMGGMPGGPGMGFGKKSKGRIPKSSKKKKKGRSGNPAKRAQQESEAQLNDERGPAGSAFGVSEGTPDPSEVELPAGMEKFLK